FLYDNVRDGILALTEDLFKLDIREWDTPTWHEDVEAYEVVEGGKVIGRFYFDNHPRQGKYTHANMIPLRAGLQGRTVPVGALVQNFPEGKMEHGQVETFLHEFGHMLHGILGGQSHRWFGTSGITNEWDFVEAPSQVLENWVYDYDTLSRFAKNEKGETIPRELVEKMNAARYFGLGLSDMRQLGLSNISLKFHEGVPQGNLGDLTRQYEGKFDPMGYPTGTQMQDAFGHLNGYSAAYYTYRWSVVVADDMFTRFAKEGLRNPQTAADYRNFILAPGGSGPSAALVKQFLGRDISLDAYREKVAKGMIPAAK
ncbi:MAG: tetraacyldisaccharide 4'-kinase, partial [Alphaproteobacteria bacterium]